MTAPTAPTIHQAMSAVMGSIGAVGKDRRNEHFKYQFRGIDDVLNAVHHALVKHGVFYMPEVLDTEYGIAGKQRVATLRVKYRFYGPAGDSVEAITVAEGMDSGDKAPNKAMSAALKYALIQVFAIPTEDQADTDREAPDTTEAPTPTPPPSKPAERNARQDAVKVALDNLDEATKAALKQFWTDEGLPMDLARLSDEQCDTAMRMVDQAGSVPF